MRDKLALSTIKAPMPGRVVSTSVITGAIVQPQVPVIQLARSDPYQVEADLTDDQIQQIAPTQQLTFTLYTASGEQQNLAGRLRRIIGAPSNSAAATASATAQQPASRALFELNERPKQPVAAGDLARIQTLHPNALLVEPGYIEARGTQSYIWVREVLDLWIIKYPFDRAVQVRIGASSDTQVEIQPLEQLQLCSDQVLAPILADKRISNRAIPNDCQIGIIPPAQ
jgi:hypothetical protein